MVNNTPGSVVGYKYFNFDGARVRRLRMSLVPKGVRGRIVVMADSPWEDQGGTRLGTLRLSGRGKQALRTFRICVRRARRLQGPHALYFVFEGDGSQDASLCDLHAFVFTR